MGRGGKEAAPASPAAALSRIPGYRGFIPGSQHVFGKGQGAASGAGTLQTIAKANEGQQFLHFGENRCIGRSDITVPQGQGSSLWSRGGHVPGYDGFIPGHGDGFDKPFGEATVGAKLEQSKRQAAFAGDVSLLPQSEIHSSRGGASGDLGGRAKVPIPSPPSKPPAVPGYKGYVSGRQHHYGRSFGTTLADFEQVKGVENKGEALGDTDPRPGSRSIITTSPRAHHIPGYAGYLPGLDSGIGDSLGTRTKADMIHTSAQIHPTSGETSFVPMNSIHKAMGSPRLSPLAPPPKGSPTGSQAERTEANVPGYTGYHPGTQHLFGESQGKITQELRKEHAANPRVDTKKFVSFGEPRVIDRSMLTTVPSQTDAVTSINSAAHLTGYTGHCPGMREAIGERFGVATKDALYDKQVASRSKAATTVAKGTIPKAMGSPRDTTVPSVSTDTAGRSVFQGSKIPGYFGFIPGKRSEYGKTFGALHRAMDEDVSADAEAMASGKGGATPGTSIGTTADRALWSDRTPRTPRVVAIADAQLPGTTIYSPKHPRARGEAAAPDEPSPKLVPRKSSYHRQVRPHHLFAE